MDNLLFTDVLKRRMNSPQPHITLLADGSETEERYLSYEEHWSACEKVS